MKKLLIVAAIAAMLLPAFGSQVFASNDVHIVQRNDSLWKIATQFGVTIENLKDWNGLTTNVIYANQRLIVK